MSKNGTFRVMIKAGQNLVKRSFHSRCGLDGDLEHFYYYPLETTNKCHIDIQRNKKDKTIFKFSDLFIVLSPKRNDFFTN